MYRGALPLPLRFPWPCHVSAPFLLPTRLCWMGSGRAEVIARGAASPRSALKRSHCARTRTRATSEWCSRALRSAADVRERPGRALAQACLLVLPPEAFLLPPEAALYHEALVDAGLPSNPMDNLGKVGGPCLFRALAVRMGPRELRGEVNAHISTSEEVVASGIFDVVKTSEGCIANRPDMPYRNSKDNIKGHIQLNASSFKSDPFN